jgi:hypothetical protein
MDTTSSYSASFTGALITLRAVVRDINPARLTQEQVELLHQIASLACHNAQEASMLEAERDLALCEQAEANTHARIMWVSDAADHQIAHLV